LSRNPPGVPPRTRAEQRRHRKLPIAAAPRAPQPGHAAKLPPL